MYSPTLYLEILLEIVSICRANPAALGALSLSARALRFPAQVILFETLVYQTIPVRQILHRLRNSTALCLHVKRLIIGARWDVGGRYLDIAIDLPSLQAILRLTSPLSVLHLNNLVWMDHHQQIDPTSPLSTTSYQNSVTRLSVYNITPDDNYSPLELLSLFHRITVLSLRQSLNSCGSGTFTWISNVRIRHLILNMNYIAVDSMCDCTPSSLERLDVSGLEQTKWKFLVLLTQASARTLETLRLVVSNGDGTDLNMIDLDNLYWPTLPILQDVTLLPGLFSNDFFNAILRSMPPHIATIRIVDFCNPNMAPETYLRQTNWMLLLQQLIKIRSWSTLDLLLVLTSTLGSTPLPDLVACLFDARTRANLNISLREMDADDAFSFHMLDDDTDDAMSDVSDVDLDLLL